MLHKLLITRLKCYGPDHDTIFTTVHHGYLYRGLYYHADQGDISADCD